MEVKNLGSKTKGLFAGFFLWYIRMFAKLELRKVKPYIIGITGSVGKTSVRNAVSTVLESKYRVKTTGKGNSETGIPLDILGLEMQDYSLFDWLRVFFLAPIRVIFRNEKYEKYVVEMGVDSPDEPKNMSYLLKIFNPHMGVFLNVHAVHSEAFDKDVEEKDPFKRRELIIEKIADEKGKLIESVSKDGLIVVNAEDKNVMRIAQKCEAKVVTVGSKDADIVYSNLHYDLDGFACTFELNSGGKKETAELKIKGQVFGEKYGITFAVAIAVGINQGIDFYDCVKSLEGYKLPSGRMSLIKGIKGSYIIDSSYNASAQSVLDALEVLKNLGEGKRKIAVLGDMRELGDEVKLEHERVAKEVVRIADEIFLVGPLMKKYAFDQILRDNYPKEKVHCFENSFLAKDFVRDSLNGGEIILVKGSQNTIFLESVVEEIMEEKNDAEKLLCRRGEYWDGVRRNFWKI